MSLNKLQPNFKNTVARQLKNLHPKNQENVPKQSESCQAEDQGSCNNNCRTDRPKDNAIVARQLTNLSPKDQ